jgi:hypothetical protein
MQQQNQIDFARVNRAALPYLPDLVRRWLPQGRLQGLEWVALNPTRADRSLGSFKINIVTGKWADFATGDRGGDIISLAAYIGSIGQGDAALQLARELGVDHVY